MGVKYGDTLPLNNGNTTVTLLWMCSRASNAQLPYSKAIHITVCKAHSALIKWGFEYN